MDSPRSRFCLRLSAPANHSGDPFAAFRGCAANLPVWGSELDCGLVSVPLLWNWLWDCGFLRRHECDRAITAHVGAIHHDGIVGDLWLCSVDLVLSQLPREGTHIECDPGSASRRGSRQPSL